MRLDVKGLNSPGKLPSLANLLFALRKAQKCSFSFYLILFPSQHKQSVSLGNAKVLRENAKLLKRIYKVSLGNAQILQVNAKFLRNAGFPIDS